ncbi:MAG: class I adenylate-forming enzyme family protein [Alphaproteobacteria bacterium]
MRPFLVTPEIIEGYLDAGHWTRDTMVDRYRGYAAAHPDAIALRGREEQYSWGELDDVTTRLAANLVDLGIERDATALVQVPSTCREIILRVALKKAGIIGMFAPLQWRRKELDYVRDRIVPALIVTDRRAADPEAASWFDNPTPGSTLPVHRLDLAQTPPDGWRDWDSMLAPPADAAREALEDRTFRIDEISLISASSGTSGLAKLCEWPEGAQICMGRVLRDRMGITADDNIGMFAPMSGAAGLVVWMMSWAIPCTCTFPDDYHAATLLDLVHDGGITAGTTVPVILARMAREPVGDRDLSALRLMRVGTAAANIDAARTFEQRTGCRIVIASGSMECTGFGHAHVNEPMELRLNGSVGLPLEGCRLRIDDPEGNPVPAGTSGELKVTAPFSSSGYWKDREATAAVWSDGWYATGDIGVLDETGRLTLLGRLKDVINRSGHKILPAEVETEIARHPNVVECAVVAAPDAEYGEVPWAFVQSKTGAAPDSASLTAFLKDNGLASYKFPARYVGVADFPRVGDNKIDKKALLQSALECTE